MSSDTAASRALGSHRPLEECPWLREIITNAMPLWERVERQRASCDDSYADEIRAERRIGQWKAVMGGSDPLEKRLAPASLEEFRPFLSGSLPIILEPEIPAWASTLKLVLDELTRSDSDTGDCPGSDRHLPFQDVFVPFVTVARELLRVLAGSNLAVLGPSACVAFERQLLSHLSFVANLPLAEDFCHFRFQRAPASAFEAAWNQTEASTELYDAYVAQLRCGDLFQLMQRRPVLARLLGQSINQWVSFVSSLCRRFATDFSLLEETFQWNCRSSDGAIQMVRTDLSDRHSGGQTVTELILGCGSRIIYKPRSVKTEQVFYQFLSKVISEKASLSLRTLRIIDRGDYGWCEVATPSPCISATDVSKFYSRAGMLLAVLHLLAITDIHCENIIAAGEHPVIVDLETMLNAWVPSDGSSTWSVVHTGLLPRWQTAPDRHRFDLSGLGADEKQDAGIRRRGWLRVNTDQMHLSDPLSVVASMTHRPRLAGITPNLRDYAPELVRGFKEMYMHLLRFRDTVLSDETALAMFDDLELRILLRGTTTYTHLQLRLLHPEFMANGLDRSIELEWLARPMSAPISQKSDRQKIYDHERTAMENLDVPIFSSSFADLVSVNNSDPDVAFLRARRDASLVRKRLKELSLTDCNQQMGIIIQAVRDRVESPA